MLRGRSATGASVAGAEKEVIEAPDPLNETDRARRMYHRRSSSRLGLGIARYQVFLYPSSTHTARGGPACAALATVCLTARRPRCDLCTMVRDSHLTIT